MSLNTQGRAALYSGVAIAVILISHPAAAQQQAPGAPPSTAQLEEVVVTATRQTSTVNRVPLSISASTQKTLDQQGISTVSDLQRTVPSLSVSAPIGGAQSFSVRGIVASQGAATTGVYVDDTNLTKRNAAGPSGISTANGSPAPPLFDLERVEVLRGPQGTLYGGSSEGGTVRFITPQPSLTRYSGYARAEVSQVKDGGTSYEGGVAVGGPIVQDKLGFRVSAFDRRTAGYIDMLDPYNNGALVAKDANSGRTYSLRGALAWAPTDRSKITASWLHYKVTDDGGLQQSNLPVAGTFTTPAACFDTRRQFGQVPAPTTAVTCAPGGQSAQAAGIYQRPSQTYGPFNYFGRNKAIGLYKSPAQTTTDAVSLTFDYAFDTFAMKAVTSYVFDETTADAPGAIGEVANRQATTLYPGATGFPLFALNKEFAGFFDVFNRRRGITEEIRFSSTGDGAFTWVGGIYYSNMREHAQYCTVRNQDTAQTLPLYGLTSTQVYGVPTAPCTGVRDQNLNDNEIAAFGEGNYKITENITATAGARISRVQYSFAQSFYGTTNGYLIPTFDNRGLTQGSVTESPISPKFGLQYRFTPDQMVYVTAAKGFRSGGVNTPVNPLVCGAALAAAGLTVSDIPVSYGADTVWSYEAGGKFRLLDGRLQLNGSVYKIDWNEVQLTVSGFAGCPNNWIQNAGAATSKGFDFDAQARLFGGLSATLAVGYTNAQYTQTTRAPSPTPGTLGVPVVRQGDRFPVPVWQASLGLRYDFQLADRYSGYVRGDYFYQSDYLRGPGPGVSQFAPDFYKAPPADVLNVRAGLVMGPWEVNVFVKNLLDSQDELSRVATSTASPGRSGCAIAQGAACTTFTSYDPFIRIGTFRPREFGLQTSYRF